MAIGDAFGTAGGGLEAPPIMDWYGRVTEFQPRTFADGEEAGWPSSDGKLETAL